MISRVARRALMLAIHRKARLKARAFAANAMLGEDVEIGSTASIANRTGSKDAIQIHDFASVHGRLDVEQGGGSRSAATPRSASAASWDPRSPSPSASA